MWPEQKKHPENENRKQSSLSKEIDRNFLIGRYNFLVLQIENQIKEANESKKAETGIVVGIGDFIGEKTGAYETGKIIYSRIVAQATERAKEIHSKILSEFDGKDITEPEKAKIAVLISRLEKASEMKLESVSWGRAVFNTAWVDSEAESNALSRGIRWTLGVAEGTVEWVFGIISGVLDVTKFLYKYTESSIGKDPVYKKKIDEQVAKIYTFVEKEGLSGMGSKMGEVVAKEWDKISVLPMDEQADAIGKFAGNVISAIMAIKGGLMLAEKVSTLGGKATQVERVTAKLMERGADGSARAVRVAELGKEVARAKNVFFAADNLLNGPAESLIGTALALTLNKTLVLLKTTGVSFAEKIVQIQNTIHEMDHAMGTETDALRKGNITKAKEALTTEEQKLRMVTTEALYGHSNRASVLQEGQILPIGGSSIDTMDFHLRIDQTPEIASVKNRMMNDSELHARWEKVDPSFPSKIDSQLFSLLFLVENRVWPSLISTAEWLAKRDALYSAEKTASLSRLMDEKAIACAESSVEAKLLLDQVAKEIPELSWIKTSLINGEVVWGRDHEFWEAHTYLFVEFQWKGYIFDPMNPIRQANGVFLPKVSSVPSDFQRAISGSKAFIESADLITWDKAYYWIGDFLNVNENNFPTVFGEEFDKRVRKAEARSWISPEQVLENSRLDTDSHLQKIQELLTPRELTIDQKQAIRGIYFYINRGAYQNQTSEIRTMTEKLKVVGFSNQEIRKILENW